MVKVYNKEKSIAYTFSQAIEDVRFRLLVQKSIPLEYIENEYRFNTKALLSTLGEMKNELISKIEEKANKPIGAAMKLMMSNNYFSTNAQVTKNIYRTSVELYGLTFDFEIRLDEDCEMAVLSLSKSFILLPE